MERTRSRPGPVATPGELDWLSPEEPLAASRQVCLIGVHPDAVLRWEGRGAARLDVMPLRASPHARERPMVIDDRTRLIEMSAFRFFRLDRRRYDLIYQRGGKPGGDALLAEYTLEWLTRLADRTLEGGQVILDVPLTGMNPAGLAIICRTFQRAMEVPVLWCSAQGGGGPVLRLIALSRSGASQGVAVPDKMQPAERLLGQFNTAGVHSLRRDHLRTALGMPADSAGTDALLDWLNRLPDVTRSP
jgi:hypothetical protein